MVNISSCWLLDFPASLLRPDIEYLAFSMSDLPLTLVLFLMQIIAQFFMSLLNSILCDLFLYTIQIVCGFFQDLSLFLTPSGSKQ